MSLDRLIRANEGCLKRSYEQGGTVLRGQLGRRRNCWGEAQVIQ
jgi:hypothetical protein